MGNYCVKFLFLLLINSYILIGDGIPNGIVVRVISGNKFIYKNSETGETKIYKLVCSDTFPIKSQVGIKSKFFLESKLLNKRPIGVIRGYNKNKEILVNILDSKDNEGKYVFLTTVMVNKNLLKKYKDYKECWEY